MTSDAHVWTVADGKITTFRMYTDTTKVHEPWRHERAAVTEQIELLIFLVCAALAAQLLFAARHQIAYARRVIAHFPVGYADTP